MPFCGDGVTDGIIDPDTGTVTGEECDDGASNNDFMPDKCRTSCLKAHCGDDVKDSDEECDFNNDDTAPNRCRTDCRDPHCGDNVKDFGEVCDGPNGCGMNETCEADCQACRAGQ